MKIFSVPFLTALLLLEMADFAVAAGCCSQKFLSCDVDPNWCGTTKESCEACGDTSFVWLESGALAPGTCLERWLGCGDPTQGECCNGARCRAANAGGWLQCLSDLDNPPPGLYDDPAPTPPAPTPTPPAPTPPAPTPTPPAPTPPAPTPTPPAPTPPAPTPTPPAPTPTPPAPTPTVPNPPPVPPVPSTTPGPTMVPPTPPQTIDSSWMDGKATVYGGNPFGNACGMIAPPNTVFPYAFLAAAGGDTFDSGYGCGACFEIQCEGPYGNNPSCFCDGSTPSVIVQINDQCPECASTHIDLNAEAMERVVGDGLSGTCGVIETQMRRVNCDVLSTIKIRSKEGTSEWWYGLHVENVAGYGDIHEVRLKEPGSSAYDISCDKSQGPSFFICDIEAKKPLQAPLSVALTDSAGRVIFGEDVISNFGGGQQFDFGSNFPPIPPKEPTESPTNAPVTPNPTNIPTVTPSPTIDTVLLSTANALDAWQVFEGLSSLTKINSQNPPNYALLAEGGAANSNADEQVVSESQAYALLITGTVLASWDQHGTTNLFSDRNTVLTAFEGYFNFWKKMCQNSQGYTACQNGGEFCYDAVSDQYSFCLPDWKQHADGSSTISTGPAPDADEDAILGIILAVKAVENDDTLPSWYEEARQWADASATAFFTYSVETTFNGNPTSHRLLKLGSCWGGWGSQGNNPSYHSPGSYKVMRDYQTHFPTDLRSGYSGIAKDEWNKLISTSYQVLNAVQCGADGAMVPNWATMTQNGEGEIQHSGEWFSPDPNTQPYEYGAEAARTTWRVALDAVLHPHEVQDWSMYLDAYLTKLRDGYTGNEYGRYWKHNQETFPNCRTPNTYTDISIFPNWLYTAFIYGPTLSALVAGAPEDAYLIDAAGTLLGGEELPEEYYHRAWAMLSNLIISGAMENAGKVLVWDSNGGQMSS